MSASTENKDDSASGPVQHETTEDANPRAVKTFKNNERPRSSQSSDYSERRKYGNNDRNQSRGWRGGNRNSYRGGRGGFDRRRGNFGRRNNYDWRRRNGDYERPEPEYSNTNLYVANLPDEWDDKKLASIFVEFGEIESAAIMHSNRDDRQRIAFVNFVESESAAKTIDELNGKRFEKHPIEDRGLIVKKAYLKRQHHPNGGPPSRNGNRNSGRYDRNSSHGSMPGSGYQNNQGHPSNGPSGMNHNKNTHHIKQSSGRRPPSNPPIHPAAPGISNQQSFQPDHPRNQMSHNSDTDQLTQQMASNWGPNSAPERHQRNSSSNRNSYPGVQSQQHQVSRQPNQQPPQQHQQQFMMHVVPQVPQMTQNYPYMHDAQGNPMQMQVVDANGNLVPMTFQPQMMQQPQMQFVNMQGPNGEWVQQMVPVQQPQQVQQMQQAMQMQHVEHHQGNPMATQMMHGDMHQHNMMHDVPYNPYEHMQQQQMHHSQFNAEMQRANSSSQPPPGFQPGHMHEQMRQMPQGHYVEPNQHQFTASPRMNFTYPSSTQVYPQAMGLPVHPECSQAENSSNHLD